MIRKFVAQDLEAVKDILLKAEVFSREEIEVAFEVIDVYLSNPKQRDYELYASVDEINSVVGYLCIGSTPITKGTFDLYWIAVRPDSVRKGVGRELLKFAENLVRSKNGRLLVAETSSQPRYEEARKFYMANGFELVAKIKDYYDVNDDLLIYGKYLQ